MSKKELVKFPLPKEAPKLALVVWEDATQLSSSTWIGHDEAKYQPCYFWQVGFMVYDGEEGVILSEAWNKELLSNPTQIPRGMIRKVQYLLV